MDILKLINDFFALVSKTYIFGLPLDTTLHILVGAFITYVGLKMKFSFFRVFIFLFCLESIKAISAAMTIDHDIWHGLKEFLATFIYPAIVFLIRLIKKRGSKKNKQEEA